MPGLGLELVFCSLGKVHCTCTKRRRWKKCIGVAGMHRIEGGGIIHRKIQLGEHLEVSEDWWVASVTAPALDGIMSYR